MSSNRKQEAVVSHLYLQFNETATLTGLPESDDIHQSLAELVQLF